MSKYIDAEKLTKAIEEKGLDCSFALKMERLDTLALIDELQQEQPEVDLEKEVESYLDGFIKTPTRTYFRDAIRHFYNRGLNARKEDEK